MDGDDHDLTDDLDLGFHGTEDILRSWRRGVRPDPDLTVSEWVDRHRKLHGHIERWPIARLKPYARNANTHDADQVAKIAASMVEFGWTVPVLVAADGELIAGNGGVLAAANLKLAEALASRMITSYS